MKIGITLTSSLDIEQKYIHLTEKVAQEIAQKGCGIVYGGTDYGMMKVLAETYKDEGGTDLTGVLSTELMRVTKNYRKYERLDHEYIVETMEDRKQKIISLSDAYLILPGGYGTFEEIGSIIGGQANMLYSKPIAVYNYEGFYDMLLSFLNEMKMKNFSRIHPSELFFTANNLEDIFNYFEQFKDHTLKDKFV